MSVRAHENPFRTTRIGALAFRHPTLDVAAIAARLATRGMRGEIVGPHGSGKTTLLAALGHHLARHGYALHRWVLHADRPAPATRRLARAAAALGPRDALLFDGAGHLGRPAWWRVARAARGVGALVVTAHEGGRLPALVTTRTDLALLASLARELLGPGVEDPSDLLGALFETHHGNLRDVFLALYDLAADGDPRLAPAPGAPPQESSSSISGPPSSPASPISSSSAGTIGGVSSPGLDSSASVVGMPMRNAAKPGITT